MKLNILNTKQLQSIKNLLLAKVAFISNKNLGNEPYFKNETDNIRIMLFEINMNYFNTMSIDAVNVLKTAVNDQLDLNYKLDASSIRELREILEEINLATA